MDSLSQMFRDGRYAPLVPPVVIFLLAFFISVHATRIARRLSLWTGFLDSPSARKAQQHPVPLFGGVAIALSTSLALWLSYGRTPEITLIMAVGVAIALVGFLDDLFGVSALVKLFALMAGCAVLYSNGIGLNRTPWPVANFGLTFLWVAGVSSAFNAIDNKDGLAALICFIGAVSLFVLGWNTWQIGFSFLAAALAGSVLGFVHFNWPPARIYMGDSGSFFIGYILAILVVYGEWASGSVSSFISGLFVVFIPVYDLGLTTLLRIRHGVVRNPIEAITCSDSDHTSHRLLALGVPHIGMLASLGSLAVLCSILAAVIRNLDTAGGLAVAFIALLGFGAFGWVLDRRTSKPGLWRENAKAVIEPEVSGDANHS